MNEQQFIVRGRAVTQNELLASSTAERPARKTPSKPTLARVERREDATISEGFIVTGYRPGVLDCIPRAYERALKAASEDGAKAPGTTEEFRARWLAKNKPVRVRPRPYGLSDAAEQCAELARKAGWQMVSVDEVLKA